MASPIAHAPHSGPVDTPGEGAYLYARAGIARSATTRSNYVAISTSIDWIVRDTAGTIISTTDISGLILHDSLRVTQALNDEPDTCSFTLTPQAAPAPIPAVGQEIRIAWAPGGPPLFHGYIVTSQSDWRALNQQPPWVAIHCQDPMWRFDARIVTYRFPAQSVSDSIAFLVKWFCNTSTLDAAGIPLPSPADFSTAAVQPGMPSIPAFDVVNQRPSTVMRTLTASVGGGFYIEGLTVHAWANSVSEPNQSNPEPLTVGLRTLHSFRRTEDATQVRRRVTVEGHRSDIQIGLPAVTDQSPSYLGVALTDASWIPGHGPGESRLARLGTQWVRMQNPISPTAYGINPPQSRTLTAFAVGGGSLTLAAMPMGPPTQGWIRVGNQYAYYKGTVGNANTDGWQIVFPNPATDGPVPYGRFTVPIALGETVEWVECLLNLQPHGLTWSGFVNPAPGDATIRAHAVNTPLVTVARAQLPADTWPPLEGFVQDGRYSYAGAQARADSDLATFKDPLVSVDWTTDDLNALPGRSQVIALSSEAVNPPINTTVTILRVEITFPLRTLPPRRSCTGGTVKPSTFMDLVVTENS
jgi:hypothetical protein